MNKDNLTEWWCPCRNRLSVRSRLLGLAAATSRCDNPRIRNTLMASVIPPTDDSARPRKRFLMKAKKVPEPTDKHVGARVRMRRMMLSMSQEKLGNALGLTFQQVQKYEKGTNRIGASRLQHISNILQVPVSFFFEGAPRLPGHSGMGEAPSPAYVSDFLATSDGLSLIKSFVKIKNSKLRRRIVDLVDHIAESR
jgi:transcriptional regulator with XRE-family HTH domain